jgi:hypothetical protein
MRAFLLLLVLLVAACGRPLTGSERALLAPIHGAGLDADRVRLHEAPLVGAFPITFDARPRVTCRERIGPPQTGRLRVSTAGIVLFERLFTAPAATLPDYAAPLPDGRLNLAAAMFLAHEMTHVWQWQNRRLTGYHPLRAFAEQVTLDDPYLFGTGDTRPFLDRGYEVQASLVEEYLCCATLDPDGARTGRLHALLSDALPVAPPATFHRPASVPYATDLAGICSD